MQKFNFYSVYDSAVEEFLPPFTAKNDKIAVRIFETAKNQKNVVLDDLTLFSLPIFELTQNGCEMSYNFKQLATFVNGEMVVVNEAKE